MSDADERDDIVPVGNTLTAEEQSRSKRKAALFLKEAEEFVFDFGGEVGQEAYEERLVENRSQLPPQNTETEMTKEEELNSNMTFVREAMEKGRKEEVHLSADDVKRYAAQHLKDVQEKLFSFENVWTTAARTRFKEKYKEEKKDDKRQNSAEGGKVVQNEASSTAPSTEPNAVLSLPEATGLFCRSLRRYDEGLWRAHKAHKVKRKKEMAKRSKREREII